MARLTTDPTDPDLGHGGDTTPGPQNKAYLVLSDADLKQGFVQPVRRSYRHSTCGQVTSMSETIARTYAADPWFYGATYCCTCYMHLPLAEFTWHPDGEPMSPAKWPPEIRERCRKAKEALANGKKPEQAPPRGADPIGWPEKPDDLAKLPPGKHTIFDANPQSAPTPVGAVTPEIIDLAKGIDRLTSTDEDRDRKTRHRLENLDHIIDLFRIRFDALERRIELLENGRSSK